MPDFIDRTLNAIEERRLEEFIKDDPNFKIYPHDLSQIDHETPNDGR